MCPHKHTDGWSLPVEPVICVAWKWEWVIAAEVVAGIGILKAPNGRVHKKSPPNKSTLSGQKSKAER